MRKKQRHTAKRVYDRLREKYGDKFNCSYRTVAGYVAGKKKELYQNNSCRLPLEHKPGEAQVQVAELTFMKTGYYIMDFIKMLPFPYSNAGYVQLFKEKIRSVCLRG